LYRSDGELIQFYFRNQPSEQKRHLNLCEPKGTPPKVQMKKRANSQGSQNECRAERNDKRELGKYFFLGQKERKLPRLRLCSEI